MKVTGVCYNLGADESSSVPRITFLCTDEIYVIYLLKKNKPLLIKYLYESLPSWAEMAVNVWSAY